MSSSVELLITAHREMYGEAPDLFKKMGEYAAANPLPPLNEDEAQDLLSVYGQGEALVERRPELKPLLNWIDEATGCNE